MTRDREIRAKRGGARNPAGGSGRITGVPSTTPANAAYPPSVDGPFPTDTVVYGYDALRRRTSRTLNGVTVTQAYDGLGRPDTLTSAAGTFTPAYVGTTGRLASLTLAREPDTERVRRQTSGSTGRTSRESLAAAVSFRDQRHDGEQSTFTCQPVGEAWNVYQPIRHFHDVGQETHIVVMSHPGNVRTWTLTPGRGQGGLSGGDAGASWRAGLRVPAGRSRRSPTRCRDRRRRSRESTCFEGPQWRPRDLGPPFPLRDGNARG